MVAKFTYEVKIFKKGVIIEIRHSIHWDHTKHFINYDQIKNYLI